MGPSELPLSILREDEEFILDRGERPSRPNSAPVLLLAPSCSQRKLERGRTRPSPMSSLRALLSFVVLNSLDGGENQSLRTLRIVVSSFFLVLQTAVSGHALDPGKRITQYQHKTWRVQDGFLPSGPQWVSQTEDGYLWVGGPSMGAFRFDGVHFSRWSPPIAFSNDIRNFLPAKTGGFWIRDRRSVTHVVGRRVISHFDFQGIFFSDPGKDMLEDADGSLWVVMARYEGIGAPVCRITDFAAHCFGEAEGMPFQRADSILPDGEGGFWIGTDTSLVHWKSGHSNVYGYKALRSSAGRDGIVSLASNSDSSLWIGIARSGPGLGLEKFVGGELRPFLAPNFDGSKIVVSSLLRDSNQTLWVGTATNGLYRIHGEAVDHFGATEGLSSDTISGLYEDREGNIWVATSGGLDSFSDRNVTTFSHAEGLPSDLGATVMASRDGTVWVANIGSLDFIRNGEVSSIRSRNDLPGDHVTSLFEDRTGQIWVGIDDDLFLYENHQFRRLPEQDHRPLGIVVSITEDVDGNIWAECVSSSRKLVRIRDFRVQEVISSSRVPAGHSLAADPKGGIWVSAVDGDLVRFHDGVVQTFQLKLKGDLPRQIEAEPDGSVLLAAPTDGLIRWSLGSFQRLTTKNGLPCDGLLGFVRDDEKQWWLETPCGYIFVADSEMQRWWLHADTVVQYRLFDSLDGARTNLVSFNPAAKSPDGRLWFATGVLQTIDPRHLLFNRLPPPVHIEQLIADRKTYEVDSDANRSVALPPRVRDLQIDYTALSLTAPQKVFFRYRLEGRDADWQDPGTRRQAFYNDLKPGHYRFRVIACNNSGVWNNTGASLDFSVAPAFYQTSWFRLLCVAALVGLLWALYQLRIRQMQRQFHANLEARVDERTRIARELHDTLLQSFQGLTLHFQRARNLLPGRTLEAIQTLDAALDGTEQAIVEGRDAIHDLRSPTTGPKTLEEEITALGEELVAKDTDKNEPVDFRIVVEGSAYVLRPNLHIEIFRIVREALRNAFSHSQGHLIETELAYTESLFRLRIRDDGKGIVPDERLQAERTGHWGLRGMRERAAHLGGELEVWSEPGAGTEIELRIPAAIAYETVPSQNSFWLFWRRGRSQ
jgi:signal transduction histidine kinase